jgi:hypothetical protein
MEKQVAQKEAQKRIEDIENEIFLNKEKAKADAQHYSLMKTIEAEHAQLTKEYLMKLSIESVTNNAKMYFGESIPKFFS